MAHIDECRDLLRGVVAEGAACLCRKRAEARKINILITDAEQIDADLPHTRLGRLVES